MATAAAAAVRKVAAEAEAAAQEEEEAEDGAGAARPRLQQEAMNGDRTESDWQGLVSEVRPRRRPGGKGRAVPPEWPSRAGTRARSGGTCTGGPRARPCATLQVRCPSAPPLFPV